MVCNNRSEGEKENKEFGRENYTSASSRYLPNINVKRTHRAISGWRHRNQNNSWARKKETALGQPFRSPMHTREISALE